MASGVGIRAVRSRGNCIRALALATLGVSLGLGGGMTATADSTESGASTIEVPTALSRATYAFDVHAKSWMADLEKNEATNRRKSAVYSVAEESVVRFDGYSDQYETQVKPTGHAGAPFVGILRYKENLYTCMAGDDSRCTVSRSVPVSEIFSYKNGRWTY